VLSSDFVKVRDFCCCFPVGCSCSRVVLHSSSRLFIFSQDFGLFLPVPVFHSGLGWVWKNFNSSIVSGDAGLAIQCSFQFDVLAFQPSLRWFRRWGISIITGVLFSNLGAHSKKQIRHFCWVCLRFLFYCWCWPSNPALSVPVPCGFCEIFRLLW